MIITPHLEFLDLRHFRAHDLRALLQEEEGLWRERLRWDYGNSSSLLQQYIDSGLLTGYVATDQGKAQGFTFSVQEDTKAIVGDVFATRAGDGGVNAPGMEDRLLEHLLETLLHTPGVDRIEAQFMLHDHDTHRAPFERAGARIFPRLFLELDLMSWAGPSTPPHNGTRLLGDALYLRHWTEADFVPAARTIAAAYAGHIDGTINDQYNSVAGAQNFLHNVVHFPGCGTFEPGASWVVSGQENGSPQALLLASRISADTGHITQVCVLPGLRGRHVGRGLMDASAASLRQLGCTAVTLTVTEANRTAVELYRKLGYRVRHVFDAMLWTV